MAGLFSRRPLKIFQRVLFFVLLFAFFSVIWVILKNSENFEDCFAMDHRNCGRDNSSGVIVLDTEEPHYPSIILLEGHSKPHLTPRMWCAVESAAMAHPNTTVFIMMTAKYLRETPVMKTVMAKYNNIKIVHLSTTKLFSNSLLEEWFSNERWQTSSWPKSHFNDALRWMLVWKYGGVYLDLDVVVTQDLLQLGNFTGLESDEWVGAGVIGVTKRHPIIMECLKWINENLGGNRWGSIGPELLTNVLQEKCGMELPTGSLKKCDDFKVYPKKTFYPIPWWQWANYLEENIEFSEEVVHDKKTYVIHVWNLHTHSHPVLLYQANPYAVAAAYYCPIVVYEVGSTF